MKLIKRNSKLPNFHVYELQQGGLKYIQLIHSTMQRWLICKKLLKIRKAIRDKLEESKMRLDKLK